MPDCTPVYNFYATGIGSLPFRDIKATCQEILGTLSDIPFWPQFVRRSHLEDMIIQFSEGLPLLKILEDERALVISSADTESQLVNFYEHFLGEDTDYFAISREYAPGLYELVESIRRHPERYGSYVKGQTVGPVTFAAAIKDHKGKSILHSPELLEAMVKGLSIKALWQVRKLSESTKRPIIFLDEPYLSGFGSAFTPIQRHEVIGLIQEVIGFIRERSDALIGIHCCGNTDWPMIMETGPDIINFDAFNYLEHFLLYPEDIIRFIRGGGSLAWGIVPTADSKGDKSPEHLSAKLEEGLERLTQWGIDRSLLAERSMLTPACGMGTLRPERAREAMDLLCRLSGEYVCSG